VFLAWRCLKEPKLKDLVVHAARSALQFIRRHSEGLPLRKVSRAVRKNSQRYPRDASGLKALSTTPAGAGPQVALKRWLLDVAELPLLVMYFGVFEVQKSCAIKSTC
jgi:hypothetical protein